MEKDLNAKQQKYVLKLKAYTLLKIKYNFEEKDRVYHSDFYIKSTWTYSGEIEKNTAKKQACVDQATISIFT